MKLYPKFEAQTDEVPLFGILSEFRVALREEINASRKFSTETAVPLLNGHKIAQIGSHHQYKFELESALNLPSDSPGDLHVPGLPPIETIIVLIEGMTVILSVNEDIGSFVSKASLKSDLAFLMRILIQRIEEIAKTPNPAGDRILGGKASGQPVSQNLLYPDSDNRLNNEQLQAVLSSLGRDTTFIQGPPGTGKTTVIGSIGKELFRKNRSALLVSHTNIAVDQALLKIGESVSKEELDKGLIIRVGVPADKSLCDQYPELLLDTHVEKRSAELKARRDSLSKEQLERIEVVKSLTQKASLLEWVIDCKEDLLAMEVGLNSLHAKEEETKSIESELTKAVSQSDYWVTAQLEANGAQGFVNDLERIESQLKFIAADIDSLDAKLIEGKAQLKLERGILDETTSVGWILRQWRRLPSPEVQKARVEKLNSDYKSSFVKLEQRKLDKSEQIKINADLMSRVDYFYKVYSKLPHNILEDAETYKIKLSHLRASFSHHYTDCMILRVKLENELNEKLSVVKQFTIINPNVSTAEDQLIEIQHAHEQAKSLVTGLDIRELKSKIKQENGRLQNIEIEIQGIDVELTQVADKIISEAFVIATTLTRAYLRDQIRKRRFDTVILDEASMAPIPALWFAASLAETNIVVVGDPKQLPPIVISEHNVSKDWLGTDIFVKANVIDSAKENCIQLRTQYRMHPSISRIVNRLIYNGSLNDGKMTNEDGRLSDWYREDWGYDSPVLLLDTGPANAWVTNVKRGNRASRLNFLSATICIDLALQILKGDREQTSQGSPKRILIVCPYRPHARLLQLLIRQEHIESDVTAGTVHNFQGSEADVVIFDLVNDDPHWKVALFMQDFDETNKRIFNVALTRARRRLLIVGDFKYNEGRSKKAFLGTKLIPFLVNSYKKVNALDVIPVKLAERAAKYQSVISGGPVAADSERLVMTQEKFYSVFTNDISMSRSRIVIYSPFITQDRVCHLETHLKAAVERGVDIYLVTKSLRERGARELSQYRYLERELTNWGVVIIHKYRMHEKLIFIDDSIIWTGSLNPLSFSDTQEIMERRNNEAVFSEIAKTIRLNDLVGEFTEKPPSCPICDSEIEAREGRQEPFFWQCVQDDCYSRDIDKPKIEGGAITCSNCGQPVEYGEWGDEPSWRCVDNRKHHQRIARTHLRLQKMRALIPNSQLKILDIQFGLTDQ